MEPWLTDYNINYCQVLPRKYFFLHMFCFVSILVVLTMKTNEAVGYQGCPIHLVAQHFLLPGPVRACWVATTAPLITLRLVICTGTTIPVSVCNYLIQEKLTANGVNDKAGPAVQKIRRL